MKITLELVKSNPQVKNFIEETEKYLNALGYTDHGPRHIQIVSERARNLAKLLGMNVHEQELAAIAGYCHDMGNFMGRTQHHYWSAMLFSQIFINDIEPKDLSTIIQAIVSHDKNELKLVNKVSAVLILADKSDVHRSRVKDIAASSLRNDIHDRVNYAATSNDLSINRRKKEIILKVKIDHKLSNTMDYFEIFIDRMSFCRQAADFLGYKFVLIINNSKLC